ncbi:MAG: transketolase C-terminal domain-containing protein [Elusimicrobiota bacterium]
MPCRKSSPPKATRQAFGEELARLGEDHPELVVLDADLGKSTMTGEFMRRFPERYFDLGVAEHNMLGVAAGLALCGKTPVVTSFACFLSGRLETIRVAVAYNRANVKMAGTHAGLGVGPDGASHMALEDLAALRAVPRLTILQPADEIETRQAVEWMIRREGPVYIRLTRQKLPAVHKPGYRFRVSVADTVYEPARKPRVGPRRTAKARVQATVFATGATVHHAVAAAKGLVSRGFAVRAVNAGTIKPFDDEAALYAAARSQRIVTVEDHNIVGGLGSAVCEALAGRRERCPVVRLGTRDFGESGEGEELYDKYGLTAGHIMEACLRNVW